uniref:Cdc23 domain-containing protein n=1 Tax=Chrysotila carterae TaxID=13221 RepID=A0A7S4C3A3_CHRCT
MRPVEEGARDDDVGDDLVMLAKTYFDLNEFKRAAHILRSAKGPCGRFLRWYSLFLAGERRKSEEALEEGGAGGSATTGVVGKARATNQMLPLLQEELSAASSANGLDAFGWYLYALVLRETMQPEGATAALVQAVRLFPCLWCGWTELAALNPSEEAVAALTLPSHWAKDFFDAHHALEAQANSQAIERYESLLLRWPRSVYLRSQLALARYNLRDFDEAQSLYESIRLDDPYRLDHVDTYSNILYVKEQKRALSSLAHACVAVDKYRPEACCVIGNYYSLKGSHEKAVLYFRRALKLDAHFLSAWTLMGHEYVELKNTAAAVDAYRHAVEINAKDYRAWYGLGQTYEILQMPYYALFYYRKATALRPYDARMWCAMAGCYKQLGRKGEAILSYKRAVSHDDAEGVALQELARLYKEEGTAQMAAHCYAEMLRQREQHNEAAGAATEEALSFLAHYYKEAGMLAEAQTFATRLLDLGGPEKEEAKSLLRDISSTRLHASAFAALGED